MSDEEEERIVSSLKKNWKRTTLAIRTAEEKPPEDDQDVDKLVKSLLKLKRTGKEPLILRLNMPATAVVANGRDPWHIEDLRPPRRKSYEHRLPLAPGGFPQKRS